MGDAPKFPPGKVSAASPQAQWRQLDTKFFFTIVAWEMEAVPSLILDGVEYDSKGKPFLFVSPSGESIGFSSSETASAYLSSARNVGLLGEEQGRLFQWYNGQWFDITLGV